MAAKLQSMISEMEELEMSLSLTAEKHKTSAQQNAQKDGLILNLQSELDATQQEFETAIEEIGQRTEENEKLLNQLTELKAQHHQLQVAADESSNKVEELVDQINQLQNTNIKQHDEGDPGSPPD
ncbi:lamin-A-like [Clytia hemisphaerica]|uniref:lamin-A-like n=1 Tax=Clytia hemisphaerica TaxID=252671 RepID=UPI0034D7831A